MLPSAVNMNQNNKCSMYEHAWKLAKQRRAETFENRVLVVCRRHALWTRITEKSGKKPGVLGPGGLGYM